MSDINKGHVKGHYSASIKNQLNKSQGLYLKGI